MTSPDQVGSVTLEPEPAIREAAAPSYTPATAPVARTAAPATERAGTKRAVTAAAVGNFVEWFDYSVYGFLAAIIATQFFPSDDPVGSLMATFAVFGLTFAARPLGAIIFGHFGDKLGRRNTLAAAVILMAGASLLIAVLPTYAQIGVAAPILLALARLLQGVSAGGEAGGSSSYLVEYAPVGRRGLYGSWQQFSIVLGLLVGSGVSSLLGAVLSDDALESWGWRVPFLLGTFAGLVGLYLRLRLDDTPAFRKLEDRAAVAKAPLAEAVGDHWRRVFTGIGFFIAPTVCSYIVLVYMPTYASKVVGLSLSQALLASAIALGVLAALIPPMGALSDRVGRKPLMLAFTVLLGIATYPLFLLISTGTFAAVVCAQVLFSIVLSLYFGPGTAMYVELFPTRVRYTGIGLSLGLASAAFGGSAPFLATWLVSKTGNDMLPGFYLILACFITFLVVRRMPETARKPLI
jgi:MHS family proline/betaine transporter-like MFS transporter